MSLAYISFVSSVEDFYSKYQVICNYLRALVLLHGCLFLHC